MKADKVTVKITIEALSIDTLGALLSTVITQVETEKESGEFFYTDGDSVKWVTKREKVEF